MRHTLVEAICGKNPTLHDTANVNLAHRTSAAKTECDAEQVKRVGDNYLSYYIEVYVVDHICLAIHCLIVKDLTAVLVSAVCRNQDVTQESARDIKPFAIQIIAVEVSKFLM